MIYYNLKLLYFNYLEKQRRIIPLHNITYVSQQWRSLPYKLFICSNPFFRRAPQSASSNATLRPLAQYYVT